MRTCPVLAAALLCALTAPSARALTGGPDAFGYTFIDSDEPTGPLFGWLDIAATGMPLSLGDDEATTVPIGFPLWFYGELFHEVSVGANGALVFGDDGDLYRGNDCVAGDNLTGDDALIAALWDDLNPGYAGEIYVETVGAFPDRQLIVQWDGIPHFGAEDLYRFQVVLVETTNEILVQYDVVEGLDAAWSSGASATAGIQQSDYLGLPYSCNTDTILHDGLAVLYDAQCADGDGDGFGACDGDCDDADPLLHPHAAEAQDLIDNDCDGLIDEDYIQTGDVVFTELMPLPTQAAAEGQWFEVSNLAPFEIDLVGWVIEDGDGGSFTIPASTVINGGDHAVFAGSADLLLNGNLAPVDVEFGGALFLDDAEGSLTLRLGGTTIDAIVWDAAIVAPLDGASLYLDPDYADDLLNDAPVAWCVTAEDPLYDYGGFPGDYGTPGAPNPPGLCCFDDDGDGFATCDGDCADGDPQVFPGHVELDNLIDDDCDGLADENYIAPGDVVINEFMSDPDAVGDSHGEWIELANVTGTSKNLVGWTLSDVEHGDEVTIAGDLILPAYSYVLLGNDGDTGANGGVSLNYDYGGAFELFSFFDDQIVLKMGGVEIDHVEYSNDYPWAAEPGRSMYLDPGYQDAAFNDEPWVWCVTPADPAYDYGGGPGDYGTPRAANPAGVCCTDADADGYTTCEGDCDDANPAVFPGAMEACNGIDDDCSLALPHDEDDSDGDGVMVCEGDCDDANPDSYPGAAEICDGEDNDCDGVIEAFDEDHDADGSPLCADCDDMDPLRAPGAPELCDGVDNDCDEVLPADEADDDGDGFRVCAGDCDDGDAALTPEDADGDGASSCGDDDGDLADCDDGDAALTPFDDDGDGWSSCDGDCDDTDVTLDPIDYDNDGWSSCDGDCDDYAPALNLRDLDSDGYSSCDGDCIDTDGAINPGAEELCGDNLDNDCDGIAEDVDADADGYIDEACGGLDCDDADDQINPDGTEVCDGADNDCDGATDDIDGDGDGAIGEECGGPDCDDGDPDVGPHADEVCDDGVDNDCDGVADPDELCGTAGDDDDPADDDDEEPDDCTCRVDADPSPAPVASALLLLAALVVRRRR